MIPGRRQQGCRGSANRERCNGYLMTAYAAVVDSTFYRVRHGFAAINNAITANYQAWERQIHSPRPGQLTRNGAAEIIEIMLRPWLPYSQ